jgi:hypothetical protein
VHVFVFSFLFSKTHVQLYIFSYTIHREQSLTLLLNCSCLCCHSFFFSSKCMVFLSGSESVHAFFNCLFISVLYLEIRIIINGIMS